MSQPTGSLVGSRNQAVQGPGKSRGWESPQGPECPARGPCKRSDTLQAALLSVASKMGYRKLG